MIYSKIEGEAMEEHRNRGGTMYLWNMEGNMEGIYINSSAYVECNRGVLFATCDSLKIYVIRARLTGTMGCVTLNQHTTNTQPTHA